MRGIIKKAGRFTENVLKVHIDKTLGPRLLPANRLAAKIEHIQEELTELSDTSELLAEQADAFIDIIYLAAGALYEMQINGKLAFNEVHKANMRKVNGRVAKRPGAGPHDAIKPEDWVGPDWDKILDITPHEQKAFALEDFVKPPSKAAMAVVTVLHWPPGAKVIAYGPGGEFLDVELASGGYLGTKALNTGYEIPNDREPKKSFVTTSEIVKPKTAEELVESRKALYGTFVGRAEVVDPIYDAIQSHPNWTGRLESNHRHALRMIVEKIGRIIEGDPNYADNWQDIAGYARLAETGE